MILAATFFAAAGAGPAPLPAEELVIGGITYRPIDRIDGVDPAKGTIAFVYGGRATSASLAGFRSVAVDRYPELAKGFEALADGQPAKAAELFGRVRARASEKWLDGLLTAALVEAEDRAGRFPQAVAEYVRWLALGWVHPAVTAPANTPPKDSPELLAGIRALEEAIGHAGDASRKRKLKLLLLRAYERQEDGKAADLAAEFARAAPRPTTAAAESEELNLSVRDHALLAPVRAALAGKDFDQGLARARRASPELSREALADLFMLVGQCYEGKGDRARAGLAYMRLVVHFPENRLTPEAALAAARIQVELNRPESARKLCQMLVQRYPGSPQARTAGDRLAALGN